MPGAFLIVADIGGTNSRFALFRRDSAAPAPGLEMLRSVWLSTKGAADFGELLAQAMAAPCNDGQQLFSSQSSIRPDAFIIAAPGPVRGGVCLAPNISWPIEAAVAARRTGIKNIRLINDFFAQGYACMFPRILNLRNILPGDANPAKPRAVIGAGTGLGKALLVPVPDHKPDGPPFIVLPSEGGHAGFAFNGPAETAFAEFVLRSSGRKEVIGDMAVTGSGLEYLYAYHSGQKLPAVEIVPRLPEHPIVLEWLARFYGRACRNFVLETLALGGVFIAGGLASHVPGLLEHPAFAEGFRQNEGLSHLLATIPVRRADNPESGLWGAAICGTFVD